LAIADRSAHYFARRLMQGGEKRLGIAGEASQCGRRVKAVVPFLFEYSFVY
jgi:hypothetical protein